MIAWLQGILIEKTAPIIVINVNGVGYLIETSLTTFFKLPEIGQTLSIHLQQVVREDALLLYGFYEKSEREMFRLLIKINGVGPKLALSILSGIEVNQLVQCVTLQDITTLTKLPGVGKKTAERLVMEMQYKVADWAQDTDDTMKPMETAQVTHAHHSHTQDAISALIALGYKAPQALAAIKAVTQEGKTSEQLIRDSLRYLTTPVN